MNRKTIVMNVDYFDELSLHQEPMGPEQVEELMRECADRGVDVVAWRAHGLGTAGYPSRLIAPPEWVGSVGFPLVADRTREGGPYAGMRKPAGNAWGGKLAASLERMDPLATARDACRRHGLRFFIWLDIVDEMRNRFLLEHPECLVLGRDGQTPWPGLRSYANEAAVANQLAVVDELAAYRPDGLYLSTSCHTRHLEFPEGEDFFGFEPSVVEAYRARVGHSLYDGDRDDDAWHGVKGDAFTEFYRRVKQRLQPIGAQLAIGAQFGRHTTLNSPYMSARVPYRFETQWKRWIDEGIADLLVLADYEWPWDRVPIWEAKGITPPPGKQVADLLLPDYVKYAAGRVECLVFSSWLSAYAQHHKGASADNLEDAMRMRSQTLLETGADGICLHEAATFEYFKGFDTVTEMRRTLDGGVHA